MHHSPVRGTVAAGDDGLDAEAGSGERRRDGLIRAAEECGPPGAAETGGISAQQVTAGRPELPLVFNGQVRRPCRLQCLLDGLITGRSFTMRW
ncbi:hypothetical protein [Streptomyces paradoxus]|uniref:Uncharacterized protein n=1 Tax=Streptomyces paradoxus TaxID=66375 RepID=A0A7W9WL69_9ACTN|nr:hypothetical protein [Streptomyces paradoxus]MBB6081049.1 hypothetical protein [Streptomyces paradoxus]